MCVCREVGRGLGGSKVVMCVCREVGEGVRWK